MISRPSPGAVALWHCCACGREWRAENLGDDTECCPFAPKMLAFGAKAAWGPPHASETSDDESEMCPNFSSSAKAVAKGSENSTAPGSRSSGSDRHLGSPGVELRDDESLASPHDLEENLPVDMHHLLSRVLEGSSP